MGMDLFEAIQKRRSIRQFKSEAVPDEWVKKALEAAILAPNSSNVQTWDFHWFPPQSTLKQKGFEICFSQASARTASHLVAIVADPKLWKRSHGPLMNFIQSIPAPKLVVAYYGKLIPTLYRWGFLNCFAPIKWLISTAIGFFRPISRGPHTLGELQLVSVKSAALAAENFVLAMTAQGAATCMMEGFDECRLKRLLKLSSSARVVMVIGVGFEAERGTWGPQFRIASDEVIHRWV